MTYAMTIRPTRWNSSQGEKVIPANTKCRIVIPTKAEQRVIDRDSERGFRTLVVRLDGQRRFIKERDLRRL